MASNNDKLTLREIRSAVRSKLDDDSYDASVIDEAANEFQNELFANHRIRFMESSGTVNVTEGDTTINFPVDLTTSYAYVGAHLMDAPTISSGSTYVGK